MLKRRDLVEKTKQAKHVFEYRPVLSQRNIFGILRLLANNNFYPKKSLTQATIFLASSLLDSAVEVSTCLDAEAENYQNVST